MINIKRLIHYRFFKRLIDMTPRAIKYGFKYYYDKSFRKKCRNREKTLKERSMYKSFIGNAKSIKKIFIKKGYKCFWCDGVVTMENGTVDHKIPVSEGGGNKLKNLRLIHENCRVERDRSIHKGLLKI
jgi:5-methylcytosine-specific restriction endonuclease McrA